MSTSDPQALMDALREYGLPVAEVSAHGVSRRHENWRVELEDDSSRLLRIDRADGASLVRELAAQRRGVLTELPVVERYERLDAVIGRPAALTSWLPGAAGVGVIDAHPEALPQLCVLMGQLRASLEAQPMGRPAIHVGDRGFFTGRASWASEYQALVHGWFDEARRGGVELGPMAFMALQTIARAAPAMAPVTQGVLVHGDLRPSNFLLDLQPGEGKDAPPEITLTGVIDWEFAVIGDPLMAWALPLELPVEALAYVIEGYGRERVAQWLGDQGVLRRLQAYCLGRVFLYLARVVRLQLERGEDGSHGLQHATATLAERLAPDFVHERLAEALEIELPVEIQVPDWAVPHREVLLGALDRLRFDPMLEPSQVNEWMGAVACALRDSDHPDEGWAREGQQHLNELISGSPRGAEPIGDREAWFVRLEAQVRRSRCDAALVLLWVGYRALIGLVTARVPTPWAFLPDASLRGLQTLVQRTIGQPTSNTPADLVRDAVLAMAAERELAAIIGRELDRAAQGRRMQQLRDAWEDLTVFHGHVPQDDEDAGRSVWAVPVLLLALEEAEGLPMEKGELIHAIATH